MVALFLGNIIWAIILFLFFSAIVSPNVFGGQASEIQELEDISEEEAETARAEKSKDTTPKVAKLKVPRK